MSIVTRAPAIRPALLLAAVGLIAAAASPASAYLGSFTPADGYNFGLIQPWVDVSYFNAGQNGANAGGGAFVHVPANTGLWKVNPASAGGIYSSAAARAAAIAADPTYANAPSPIGGAAIYMVGDHPGGRTDNSSLGFRNDNFPNNSNAGPAKYDYTIDSYDYGGIAPASVTGGTVTAGLYMLASPGTTPGSGIAARDKFTMSMKDSSGNIGFQWGYMDDNEVCWRANASGPWTLTGTYVNTGLWDGISMDIDLTADTFKLSYFVASTSTWFTLVNTTAMGVPMNDLTHIGWQLEDNQPFGSLATKNFFDDFKFTVPAPGAGGLLAIGGLTLLRRRR